MCWYPVNASVLGAVPAVIDRPAAAAYAQRLMRAPHVEAFHALFLDGAALPLPLAPGWRATTILPSTGNLGVLLAVEREGGGAFQVLVEPKSGSNCFASTRYLNLSQHGAMEGLRDDDVVVPLRALAARLAEREASLVAHGADERARAVFDVAAGEGRQPRRKARMEEALASPDFEARRQRWPIQARTFHALFLGRTPLPVAFDGPGDGGYAIVDLDAVREQAGVLVRLGRDDGRSFAVVVEPRSEAASFTRTRDFNLSQHGPLDGVPGEVVATLLRAFAERMARLEPEVAPAEAAAIFRVGERDALGPSSGAGEARRVRLDVVSHDVAGDPTVTSRRWPLQLEPFHRLYFGVPLPMSLAAPGGEGWRVDSLSAARIRRGFEVRLVHASGRWFSVTVEPKTSMKAFASTNHLNISHHGTDTGLRGSDLMGPMGALAAHLSARETGLERAAVEAALSIEREDADADVLALRPIDFRINRECNEHCLFCNTPEDADVIYAGPAEVHDAIEREYARGFRRCYFTGREPTLDPNLVDYIRHARATGYVDIGMHTNATMLARAEYLDELRAAGLSSVQVSMHTFDPRTFERLVGAPRLLEKTLEGLDNLARAEGLGLFLLFVVTTLNQHELPSFLERVARDYGRRVEFVLVSPMAPMGDGRKHPELLPSLAELRPLLGEALAVARRAGVVVRVPDRCGLPLCAMPERFLDWNLELRNPHGDNVEPGKTKLRQCASCTYDSRCSGVWRGYVEAFGNELVQPVTASKTS